MTPPSPEQWTLTFTPLADAVPAEVRVRQLLKYALRAQRLKCINVNTGNVNTGEVKQFEARPGEDLALH
jgi:hypothetical protein